MLAGDLTESQGALSMPFDRFNPGERPMSKREFQEALFERDLANHAADGISDAFGALDNAVERGFQINRSDARAHLFSLLCSIGSIVATLIWLFSSGHHYWFWKIAAAAIIGGLTYALAIQAVILIMIGGTIWEVIHLLGKMGAFK